MSEILPTRDEAADLCGFDPAVEVIDAKVEIELAADQHIVDDGQDRGWAAIYPKTLWASHCNLNLDNCLRRSSGRLAQPPTAAIGASCPLRRIPVIVSFLNP
jgi:hypothetical protein